MNLQQIKRAVESGETVHWQNRAYRVIKDSIGQWLIEFNRGESYWGLTHRDGVTMNGNESEFFVALPLKNPAPKGALITFKTEESHSAFHSMTEGMMEVARDDENAVWDTPHITAARGDLLESLIGATAWQEGLSYPCAFPLSPEQATVARDVMDNMDDNERLDSEDYNPDAIVLTDGKPLLGVSVADAIDTEEALQVAIAIVTERCSETDTASPEGHIARLCLQTLEMILEQRGCDDESFHGNAPDGKLTTLMDVIIFG